MTHLNKKQKQLLTEYAKTQDYKFNTWTPAEDLPVELYEKLEELNNHETLNQNVNRFLLDLE